MSLIRSIRLAAVAGTALVAGALLGPGALVAQDKAATPAPAAAPAAAPASSFSADQKAEIQRIIKDYLVANPEVFLEVQQALEAKMEQAQAEKMKLALAAHADALFRDPNAPVAGNPKGDVTVVEFFDYNCGYCKRSFADMLKLVEADKNIRLVFKELPILSKGSEEAAKVALAARLQGKYWEVHRGIFESKAPANEANALKVAEKLGLDMARLKKDMDGPEVKAELNKTKELAARMGINGTPHFLVGDRSIPGAPENLLEQIKKNAAELRKDGCKVC